MRLMSSALATKRGGLLNRAEVETAMGDENLSVVVASSLFNVTYTSGWSWPSSLPTSSRETPSTKSRTW